MDSARALVAKGRGIALVSRTMGVSRAQLSLRINRSADWQDRRCNRRNDEADAEILSDILDIISDMPSYGYRRVWGILRKQRRTEGQPPVNAKRLYRIMSEPCVVRRLRFSGPKTSIICSPMTSLKTSIKTITYLSDIGCLEIQGASLKTAQCIFLGRQSGICLFVTQRKMMSI